jgi:hypothetical protein
MVARWEWLPKAYDLKPHSMNVIPDIEGTVSIASSPERFLQACRQRVAAGLLTGRTNPRSNYVVSEAGHEHLEIRAADWWTAINVGLNTVKLRYVHPGAIHYHVQYWPWTRFVLGLSGGLGLIGITLLLTVDVRRYIAEHQPSMIPGISVEQNWRIAWLMVLFWGFVWPWLLVALHKRPLRGLVTQLIATIDTTNAPASQRG